MDLQKRTLPPLGSLPPGCVGLRVAEGETENSGRDYGFLLSQRHQESPVELSSKGINKSVPSHSI